MSQRYLSRKDIEKIAKDVIQYYKSIMVPEKHLCYSVDPMALAHILNISVDFQHLIPTSTKNILNYVSAMFPQNTFKTIIVMR